MAFKLTDEQVDDLLVASLEQWSGSWLIAESTENWAAFVRGEADLILHEIDETEYRDSPDYIVETFTITREQFDEAVAQRAVEQWFDNHDAPEADAALQLAAFGEVRYS